MKPGAPISIPGPTALRACGVLRRRGSVQKTTELDRRKRIKAKLDIKLLYVQAGYDLEEVIAQVEAARAGALD
jgi:hypothetical protein